MISLITDPNCRWNTRGSQEAIAIDLSPFTRLKSLSWRGLRSRSSFVSLALGINASHRSLEKLVIDTLSWALSEESYYKNASGPNKSSNFFAEEILQIQPDTTTVMFPSLRKLELCSISFGSFASNLSVALNMSSLRSLKLWNCPNADDVLQCMVGAGDQIMLQDFELVSEGPRDKVEIALHGMLSLGMFLNSFRGLERLYLDIQRDDWSDIAWSILEHKSTLEHLVLHSRSLLPESYVTGAGSPHTLCDVDLPWNSVLSNIVKTTNLDYFGISMRDFKGLVSQTSPSASAAL